MRFIDGYVRLVLLPQSICTLLPLRVRTWKENGWMDGPSILRLRLRLSTRKSRHPMLAHKYSLPMLTFPNNARPFATYYAKVLTQNRNTIYMFHQCTTYKQIYRHFSLTHLTIDAAMNIARTFTCARVLARKPGISRLPG